MNIVSNPELLTPTLTDRTEAEQVTKYQEDMSGRWQAVQVELGSVGTMLEEVIAYWTRYSSCVDLFSVWLTNAEKELQRPPEEREVSRIYGEIMNVLWYT